jgi:hypothetical protein
MNDNLKNQLLLAFVLFHIKKKVVEDKKLYIDDESLTDSEGFDYESTINSTIGDSDNVNFIKLNDLNNNYKTSKKTSSSENAYLKIDNQEYNNISLQIDSIDKINSETKNKYNSSNSKESEEINFGKIFNKNEKISKIIDQYTETQDNTEITNSEYIDIIDSNRLWDMIEKNNKMIYTDNYDELSLESESLNNIVKNSAASKSVFLNESKNYSSNLMNDIMNSESSSSEYNMVDSYNFKKKEHIQKYNNSSSSSDSSENLIDSYNVFHVKEKNKKKQTSESNSDNMSVIDTYCMSNVNNKKTTSTLEECKKNTDSYNSNIFEKYLFNSYNFNKNQINNYKKEEKIVIRRKESYEEQLEDDLAEQLQEDLEEQLEDDTICTETYTRLNNTRLLLRRR